MFSMVYGAQASCNFDQQHVISTEVGGATSVFAADLDGDGDLDVLSAGSGKIAWYKNMGDGTFNQTQHVISTEVLGARSVFAGDVDGDGDLDVLSASCSASFLNDEIVWYENLGNGVFSPIQHVISTEVNGAQSLFAADVDGDGDLDVLSASYWDDKIAWHENLGGGVFNTTQHVISSDVYGANSVFPADVDGDGDLDVLSASFLDSKIAWYENLGSGQFSTNQHVIDIQADGARCVFSADVDGDGDLDVLSAAGEKIAWYENLGSGVFSSTQHVISTKVDRAISVFAADLDGDGDLDVLSASENDNKIALYENLGGDLFSSNQHVVSTEADGFNSVFVADVDGDGDLDVLFSCEDKIGWHENLGGGVFSATQRVISTEVEGSRSVFAVDLDGDGDLDVVSASENDNKIAWYENLGGGVFNTTQHLICIEFDWANSVFAADVDGDGDLDVVSGSFHRIVWFENLGSAVFDTTEHVILHTETAFYPLFGAVADLDGDGDLDVLSCICSSFFGDKISWHENLGGGTFNPVQHDISTEVEGTRSLFVADLDGDGDLDVLSASENDNKIAWYENLGAGKFRSRQHVISTEARGAVSVFAADLDGDGDLDVLSASFDDGNIAWYENLGDGTFSSVHHVISTEVQPFSVFAADLDSDGHLDVLSASHSNIGWYGNIHKIGTVFIRVSQSGDDELCVLDIQRSCGSVEFALNHFRGELAELLFVRIEAGTYKLSERLNLDTIRRTVLELHGDVILDCSSLYITEDACISVASGTPHPLYIIGDGNLTVTNSPNGCMSVRNVNLFRFGGYSNTALSCRVSVMNEGLQYFVREHDPCFPQKMAAPFDVAGIVLCSRFSGHHSDFPCNGLSAVYTNESHWKVSEQHIYFRNSSRNSDNGGGCLRIDNSDKTVLEGVTLSGCSAQYDGGGVLVTDSNVEMKDVTVEHCQAGRIGGGMVFDGTTQLTANGLTVFDNFAPMCGGLSFNTSTSMKHNLHNVHVESNRAFSGHGGGICVRASQVELSDFILKNNVATLHGGGLAIEASARVAISSVFGNATFFNNSASHGGGIVCEASVVTANGVQFVRNQATDDSGGALSLKHCEVALVATTLTRNEAVTVGGGIHCIGTSTGGTLTLRECLVEENTACVGGGLASDSYEVSMTDTSFTSNLASGSAVSGIVAQAGSGGGLFVAGYRKFSVSNCSFQDNVASCGDGGAMWLGDAVSTINAESVNFCGNCAPAGGGGCAFWDANVMASSKTSPFGVFENMGIAYCQDSPNYALYGPTFATPAVALLIEENSISECVQRSRATLNGSLSLRLVDVFNQTVRSDSSTKITLLCRGALRGFQQTMKEGRVDFTGVLWMEAKPGSVHSMNVTASWDVKLPASFHIAMGPCEPGTIMEKQVRCVPCPVGHFQNRTGQSICEPCPLHTFSANEGRRVCERCKPPLYQDVRGSSRCLLCPVGYYGQFSEGVWQSCKPCPAHAQCNAITGNVIALRGYWLATEKHGRKTTHRCSSTRACEGSGVCGPHRANISANVLCGECLSGYSEWDGECVKCEGANGVAIFLLICGCLALVGLLHCKVQRTHGGAEVYIFLFFLQMSFLFIQESDAAFWSFLFNIFQFSFSRASGGSCLFKASPAGLVLFDMVSPLFAFAALGGVWVIILCTRKLKLWWKTRHVHPDSFWSTENEEKPRNNQRPLLRAQLLRTALALYVATVNPVSKATLGFFYCIDVEVGSASKSVLYLHPAMECGTTTYASIFPLALLLALLYVFAIPAGLFFLLLQRKEQLQGQCSSSLNYALEVLCRAYEPTYFFWGIYSIFRRLILVLFAVQLSQDQPRQYLAWTISNISFLLVQVQFHPFCGRQMHDGPPKQSVRRTTVWARTQKVVQKSEFNLLETISLGLLTLLTVVGLSMSDPPTKQEDEAIFYLVLIPDLSLFVWVIWRVAPRWFQFAKRFLQNIQVCFESRRAHHAEGQARPTMCDSVDILPAVLRDGVQLDNSAIEIGALSPVQEKGPLPAGWSRCETPGGTEYFFNQETQKSQWGRPEGE